MIRSTVARCARMNAPTSPPFMTQVIWSSAAMILACAGAANSSSTAAAASHGLSRPAARRIEERRGDSIRERTAW